MAVDPSGALIVAGVFEGKLDLGSGILHSTGTYDAFIGRVGPDAVITTPAPSAAEWMLPPDFVAPPPPSNVSCDPAAGGATACDLPPSVCAITPTSCAVGESCEPNWFVYYENPRCVNGQCVWDPAYFRCTQTFFDCGNGACNYVSRTR